jgi:hypothetical protein
MSTKQQKNHNAKLDKLKDFLDKNHGREFVYNFEEFPKTVYGVNIEEKVFWDNFFKLIMKVLNDIYLFINYFLNKNIT